MRRVDVGLIAYRDRLGDPFLFLEERVVVLRAGERRVIAGSPVPKVVFVLEGSNLQHGFSGANQTAPEAVGPGQVIVNLAGRSHFYEAPVGRKGVGGGQMRALRLTFDAAFLAPATGEAPPAAGASAEFMAHLRQRLPASGQARSEAFARSLPDLRAALTQAGPDARLRINALARCVLLDVVNAWPGESPRPENGVDDGLVARVENFLEARLGEPLRLRDVARAVDRSEEHVVRRFRERRGVTVFAHLRRLRIERARYLLLCSQYSVGRIAAETGFATLAHFSRCFREEAGTSPSNYRACGGRAIR